MESLEVSAKSVDEAIELALRQLNVSRKEVEIEILSRGKAGIFGLGAEEARVRVKLLGRSLTNVASLAQEVLEGLLEHLGMGATVYISGEPGDGSVALEVRGDDLGILIGRRGETLLALQYLINIMVSRQLKTKTTIAVDVDGYRLRRDDALRHMAWRLAERVKMTGQTMTLRPMPPRERRIVHLAIQDDPDVITESVGEGEERKVTISLRRNKG